MIFVPYASASFRLLRDDADDDLRLELALANVSESSIRCEGLRFRPDERAAVEGSPVSLSCSILENY